MQILKIKQLPGILQLYFPPSITNPAAVYNTSFKHKPFPFIGYKPRFLKYYLAHYSMSSHKHLIFIVHFCYQTYFLPKGKISWQFSKEPCHNTNSTCSIILNVSLYRHLERQSLVFVTFKSQKNCLRPPTRSQSVPKNWFSGLVGEAQIRHEHGWACVHKWKNTTIISFSSNKYIKRLIPAPHNHFSRTLNSKYCGYLILNKYLTHSWTQPVMTVWLCLYRRCAFSGFYVSIIKLSRYLLLFSFLHFIIAFLFFLLLSV